MHVAVSQRPAEQTPCSWLILPVAEQAPFDPSAAALDAALGGRLSRLRGRGDLTGEQAELLELRDVQPLPAERLLIVGLGELGKLNLPKFHQALGAAVRRISDKPVPHMALVLPDLSAAGLDPRAVAQSAAAAVQVGCVGQGLYKAKPDRFAFEAATLIAPPGANESLLREGADRGTILGEAVNLTRELVNRAPQDIFPESFAQRAAAAASAVGLTCEVFDERWLDRERMHSMLAVGRGSDRAPRLVRLEHRGGPPGAPAVFLIGKGVTFDSGGLSLKPTDGMKTMKCDMAGAATVLGAMVAAARLNLPVHLVGLMGLVENMPGGSAYKLGDVLTARNGVTIEVLNTDAEGRLVLADVLSLAVDQGAAKIVDLATLTGSCVVALGENVAGAFTNDQPWCDAVLAAARRAGEDLWQLPMHESYAEQLKCDVADVKNVGTRWGGAITAAKFLEKFVGGTPWVHLDIAGPAFAESSKPYRDGGATGAYVRTLVELVSG